jgi:hypothetical protein
MFSGLFAKKPTPEEFVKKWKVEIRKEIRGLENNIRCMDVYPLSFLQLDPNILSISHRNGRKQGEEIYQRANKKRR